MIRRLLPFAMLLAAITLAPASPVHAAVVSAPASHAVLGGGKGGTLYKSDVLVRDDRGEPNAHGRLKVRGRRSAGRPVAGAVSKRTVMQRFEDRWNRRREGLGN